MGNFVHLHVHTEYSMLDSTARVDKLFARCKELGMPAIAITDHGNMFGAIAFNKAACLATDKKMNPYDFVLKAREYDVKPIFGCEAYVTNDMKVFKSEIGRAPKLEHIVLLAKNDVGYKNLLKIVSAGFVDGFYYKPRIDYALLEKHCEGLICLSACMAGSIPRALMRDDIKEADRLVEFFKRLFGEDFYIEIQDHNIMEQKQLLPKLIALARKHAVELVATNDVHYLNKEDHELQRVLQCINFRTTLDDRVGNEDEEYFPTQEFYLKSYDEMYKLFASVPSALTNTLVIAQKCNVDVLHKRKLYPEFRVSGKEGEKLLRKLTHEGLLNKYNELSDKILERAESELAIIERLGFVDYYLIVWDFIHHAEKNGIPVGPGRGSGVGSIVAYAIGITKVDPIKHDLLFERFLHSERQSTPDFDIDFCIDGRGDVIKYVIDEYHAENVAQIVTFGTLAAKSAIKDVARVYNFPFAEVNKITKAMPGLIKSPLTELLGIEKNKDGKDVVLYDLKELYDNDPEIKKILNLAMQIEGLPRQIGIHAAGVVICREELCHHIPLAKSDENVTTQYNMTVCEELGLLKMDFLGLRTLTDIKKALELIKARKNIDIDFYKMEFDDPNIYKMIGEGDTHAVFQLESGGMKRFMTSLKPENIEDIIAGISLFRPGPMKNIDIYVKNKRNPSSIKYDAECLEKILKVTYGVIVYQEQVMRIVQDMAGFTLGHADNIRRIMSKKKSSDMAKEKVGFIEGSKARGIAESVADRVFEEIASFAEYAFNKSHAAAYAYIAYQTAYLKYYHELEFMTAILNNRIDKVDELSNYLYYLKEKNIKILCPDINASKLYYAVEDCEDGTSGIRIGLGAIKNVGLEIITQIIAEREKNGDYISFFEFIERNIGQHLNKKLLESFIMAGVFDCFGFNRASLMRVYENAMDSALKDSQAKSRGQISFFEIIPDIKEQIQIPNVPEFPDREKFRKEKEILGIYASGSPLDEYKNTLASFSLNSTDFNFVSGRDEIEPVGDNDFAEVAGLLTNPKKKIAKSGKTNGEARLEDQFGSISIMVSGDKVNRMEDFVEGAVVKVSGRVSVKDGERPILWVSKMSALEPDKKSGNKAGTMSKRVVCFVYSFDYEGELLLNKLCDICAAHQGLSAAYVRNSDNGTTYKLPHSVDINELFKKEAEGLVGKDGLIIKEIE